MEPYATTSRARIRYSPADLHPTTTRDPECDADPQWPLACYWPVYLGNFFVRDWAEHTWYDQISEFFAYQGLLIRMIYIDKRDEAFWEMQRQCTLVDALVYFCSEQDAQMAISSCHRNCYYGHRLNVLPGRVPEYVDCGRAARFECYQKPAIPATETFVENTELRPHGEVVWATKLKEDTILAEFVDDSNLINTVKGQKVWKPYVLTEQHQKQRFLEADVQTDLNALLASNVGFLEQKPRPQLLQCLFDGVAPRVDTSWINCDRPRMSAASRQALANTPRSEKFIQPKDQALRRQSKKEYSIRINAHMEAINQFLVQHGNLPPISLRMINTNRRLATERPNMSERSIKRAEKKNATRQKRLRKKFNKKMRAGQGGKAE